MGFPSDICKIIAGYIPHYQLLNWIPIDKINWCKLSRNPSAIELLEANPDKINWCKLSRNPSAMELLKANPDKIYWDWLSRNPSAIKLLEANPDKIYWDWLSENPAIFKQTNKILNKLLNIQF